MIKTNELKKNGDRYFLILEHFRARTIKMILEDNKISVSDFIKIAINICEAFIEIHSKNIIHANLNTNSILLNKENEIKLTNFTYSIFEDEIYIKNEEHLDIYKAPEQTNKLKEKVTKQTDIYSLGLIFYEMLTGIIPYEFNELNSLSHNILTKEFTLLHNIDHNIPIVLSNIIKKMLEKSPQDRYSDVVSILIDLKKLLLNFEENSTKEFELDQFKKEFQSRKNTTLYGRDKELDEIIENLNRNEKNIIFVTGSSGVGKTTFVRSALEKSNIKKTNYLEIKLDNYKQNTPYKILYSKLRELSKKILTKDEETLLKWKNKILNELGNEISILFNIIPELEIIVGSIKLKEEEILNNTKININNYLFKYLQIFATKIEPLVIFIDDIQWADSITLKWIIDASFKLINTHLIITSRNTKEESEILNTLSHLQIIKNNP